MNSFEHAVDQTVNKIESEIDDVIAESMQIAQMHQDAEYGENHVREYLKKVLTELASQIQCQRKCAKCRGGGTVQRWTGEYVECDACNARGF